MRLFLVLTVILACWSCSLPNCVLVAQNRDNLRGLAFSDGVLYAAEAGRGGPKGPGSVCFVGPEGGEQCYGNTGRFLAIQEVTEGPAVVTELVSNLPSIGNSEATQANTGVGGSAIGPSDIFVRDGEIFATIGAGFTETSYAIFNTVSQGLFATAGQIINDNQYVVLSNISDAEFRLNPDGTEKDTNPYSIQVIGNRAYVADAGANTIFQFPTAARPNARVPPIPARPQNVIAPFPNEAPFFGRQAVPTGLTSQNGQLYVGQLTGFVPLNPTGPQDIFPVPEAASIFEIEPTNNNLRRYLGGLTAVTDIAVLPNGDFLATELFSGKLVRVNSKTEVVSCVYSGLVLPTGLAVNGNYAYVSNFGAFAGISQILKIDYTQSTCA